MSRAHATRETTVTPELAAGIIRFIIANEMKQRLKSQGHGKLWRRIHGLSVSAINKKKVILSNDNGGFVPASDGWDDSFVCFWVIINKPTTTRDIIIKEAKGVVMAHLGGAFGSMASAGQFGSTVQQINQVKTNVGNAKKAGGMAVSTFSSEARSTVSSGIYNQLNSAWRAGMWEGALGTRSEFAFALGEGLTHGACAISGTSDNLTISLGYWPEKQTFMSLMATAERKGLNTNAARKYVRSLCTQSSWSYGSDTQSLEKLH